MSQVKYKVCRVCKVQKLASECVKAANICKICYAKHRKAYYAANLDKQKAYHAAYRAANSDKRKAYRAANRESIREQKKDYRAANPDKQKAKGLKRYYGISLETYRQMEVDQNYCCKICNVPRDRLTKALAVDHNHTTGQVRALLCMPCNTALGMAKESPATLRAMVSYLESYEGEASNEKV